MNKVIPFAVFLLLVCNGILLCRLYYDQGHMADLAPQDYYRLSMRVDMDLAGENAYARFYVPTERTGQSIISNTMQASGLGVNQIEQGEDRVVVLTAIKQSGHRSAVYEACIRTREDRYSVDREITLPETIPNHIIKYLMPSMEIQSEDPGIIALSERIVNSESSLPIKISRLYKYVELEIENSEYENTLDAVSVSKWKEAFCGGKSRLLVALLRSQNIPARVVGGIILSEGIKRKTHVWVEVWLNGEWAAIDPTNGYYFIKPRHYLKLYNGDVSLIQRSDDINFHYSYAIERKIGTPDEALASVDQGTFSLWILLNEVGIDFNVLRIFLLLPIAVLLILVFRNIIGLECFGTFVPALLAVSFRETGIVYGVTMLVGVLFFGLLMRFYLERFKLLNTPRLAILVISVIILVMVLSTLFIVFGNLRPEHLAVYPIIILVAAVEQVYHTVQERGWQKAVWLSITTVIIVSIIHAVICFPMVQTLVYIHPELLLVILTCYLLLGRYAGLRLSELIRFKEVYSRRSTV